MYAGVQAIVRNADSTPDGLRRTIEFAQANSDAYDARGFWSSIEDRLNSLPVNSVVDWARQGVARLATLPGWDALILDLGDCPEAFQLAWLGDSTIFAESKLRQTLFSRPDVHFSQLQNCILPERSKYTWPTQPLVYHNVRELGDRHLSWNLQSHDYGDDNGYLLWLSVGSLSLLDAFRQENNSIAILKGRPRLYLLSGFEELFLYLATVTPMGLIYESA